MALAPFPVPDQQEAFDAWVMCTDAFKKSSLAALLEPLDPPHEADMGKFHILVIIKDSSVAQSTGRLSSAKRRNPTSQTRDSVLRHPFKVMFQ